MMMGFPFGVCVQNYLFFFFWQLIEEFNFILVLKAATGYLLHINALNKDKNLERERPRDVSIIVRLNTQSILPH